MRNFVKNDILFTEVPARNDYVRVQVTEFDAHHAAHSYYIYVPGHRWEAACEGDEFNRDVIKGAYELLRDNGYTTLMNA